jgi:hypothetical protein
VAKPVYRDQLASAIASAALLATLAPASGASAGHRPN